MKSRDIRNCLAGGSLIIFGVFFFIYAMQYELGSMRSMGPGFFPRAVGALIALCGLSVLLPSLISKVRAGYDDLKFPRLRPFLWISVSVALFAALINVIGLAPTTVIMVAVAAFAEYEAKAKSVAILAISLALMSYLLFSVALGLPIPVIAWGF